MLTSWSSVRWHLHVWWILMRCLLVQKPLHAIARLGAQTVKELHEDLYTMKTRPDLTAEGYPSFHGHFIAVNFKQKPYGIEAVSHGCPQHVQIYKLKPRCFDPWWGFQVRSAASFTAARRGVFAWANLRSSSRSHEKNRADMEMVCLKMSNNGVPCGTVYPMAIKVMETLIRFWIFIQICKKTCCRMFEDSGRFRPGIQWFIQVWDFLRSCPLVHQPREYKRSPFMGRKLWLLLIFFVSELSRLTLVIIVHIWSGPEVFNQTFSFDQSTKRQPMRQMHHTAKLVKDVFRIITGKTAVRTPSFTTPCCNMAGLNLAAVRRRHSVQYAFVTTIKRRAGRAGWALIHIDPLQLLLFPCLCCAMLSYGCVWK